MAHSPDMRGLTPCNPLSVDIGGSLVKVVYWKRRGSKATFPSFVKMQEGPDDLPLHPPPSPTMARRSSAPQTVTYNQAASRLAHKPKEGEKRSEADDNDNDEKRKPSLPIINNTHLRVKFSVRCKFHTHTHTLIQNYYFLQHNTLLENLSFSISLKSTFQILSSL